MFVSVWVVVVMCTFTRRDTPVLAGIRVALVVESFARRGRKTPVLVGAVCRRSVSLVKAAYAHGSEGRLLLYTS